MPMTLQLRWPTQLIVQLPQVRLIALRQHGAGSLVASAEKHNDIPKRDVVLASS